MHMRHDDHDHGPKTVPVRVLLEDPEGLTGVDKSEWEIMAAQGESLLEAAMDAGINIEQGAEHLSEATEAEEDRVEEAPGLQRNSRLSCQCEVKGPGPIVLRVPSWNRNAVKEIPH